MIGRDGGGRIISMSSVSGKKGTARYAAYSASKFAVIGFTQSLANELAPYGVRVNAICPGLIETERVMGMAEGLKPEGVTAEAFREEMIQRANDYTPLGRIGTGADVAKMAAFLASDESEYLTGLAMTVAGGSWMT
jgi:NAD(P)-dependent dehydrogenase (short-subunit alcohol dehydrogenase family)